MADLRAKNPDNVASVDGVKMLWLYGYYNAGDTSPVLYVWDDAALESDDGGSVIQATSHPGPGRWKLASTELHFDVRHFGVFGQTDKYSVDFSYTSQLANCGIFVDNAGLDAWFPDNVGNMTYYLLDGTNTFNDLVSYYTPMYVDQGTLGSISYQLNDLSPGLHTLRLRVWDVYNNVSERTIEFNVVHGLTPEIADVYCNPNPASVEASFYVKHNRPDAVISVTIEVYDLMGRRVWTSTQSGRSDMYTSTPVTWDLTDGSGRRVPRGIYVYRATISTDGVKEATKSKKLAVTGE